MKLTVSRTTLLNALQICSKAIASNPIIPILEGYLLDITPDKITVSATNLEIQISKSFTCDVDFTAKIAVSSTFSEQIKALDEQPLIIEFTESEVTISSFSGKYKLPCENGNDFPLLKITGNHSPVELPFEDFKEALFKTSFCIIPAATPMPFDGLNMQISKGNAIFTAYGNSTLSTATIAVTADTESTSLLPKRLIDTLASLPITQNINAHIGDKSITFDIDETLSVKSVLLDIKFPDFSKNVALNQDKSLVIDAAKLRKSCEAVRVMASKHTSLIILDITEGVLTIKSSDVDFGKDGQEYIENIQYSGDDFKIGVNGSFFIAALAKLVGDITLYMSEPKHAVLIRDAEAENVGYDNLMCVMPIVI